MFKFKSQNPYWTEFSKYQTFTSIEAMVEQIKTFESTYELTPSVKAVLNTIKLHAKRFIGVCWLYREEIAKKAGVSLSSVKRALKGIRETHKTKAFYIRNDIAKLIDKDIKTGQRGDMTRIVNALFEEYYKSLGRLK